MKHLEFKVNSQTLKRLDSFKPAAGSVDYLTASFTFSEDWSGTAKTAKCRIDNAIYSAAINSSGVCKIPHEVLAQDETKRAFGSQEFYISVEGVNGSKTITTEEIKIELTLTGSGEAVNAAAPTESLYAQYIADVEAATEENANTATEAATSATASATEAAASAASLKNDYANAFKGNASGAVIRLDDVSPVEHFPIVKARSKNLFLRMAAGKTVTMAGVTFTFNENGSVSLKGTATTSSNFGIGEVYLDKGTYYLCDFAAGDFPDNSQARVQIYSDATGKSIATLNNSANNYIAGGESSLPAAWYQCRIRIDEGYTYDCTLYPTLFKGEQPTAFISNMSDITAAKVKIHGKNLFKAVPNTINGVTLSQKGNYFVLNGTATASNNFVVSIGYLPAGKYTLTANNPTNNGVEWSLIDVYSVEPYSIVAVKDNANNGKSTAELAESNEYLCRIRIENGVTYNNFVIMPQLEYGEAATDYEAYKEAAEYTPEADGTINGLTSISPTMTLLSDHEGVIIDCEYNRDTKMLLDDAKKYCDDELNSFGSLVEAYVFTTFYFDDISSIQLSNEDIDSMGRLIPMGIMPKLMGYYNDDMIVLYPSSFGDGGWIFSTTFLNDGEVHCIQVSIEPTTGKGTFEMYKAEIQRII